MTAAALLFVEEKGDGPPVILLHSSGLSGRQFRRLVATLVERGFQAIVPDLTGHGRSPALVEPEPSSFARDAAWLAELLAARGPAHLVGHSYGAFVALQAALLAPAAVRSLVLFEPVAFGVLDPAVDALACDELVRANVPWGASALDHDAWLQEFVDYWGGAGAWAGQREEARAEFRRIGWAVREGVRSLAADRTPASRYRALGEKLTLIGGERSTRAARAVLQVLGAALPEARAVTISGAGHMGPLTHADEVNRVIEGALAAAR